MGKEGRGAGGVSGEGELGKVEEAGGAGGGEAVGVRFCTGGEDGEAGCMCGMDEAGEDGGVEEGSFWRKVSRLGSDEKDGLGKEGNWDSMNST